MTIIGTPHSSSATKLLLLGAGELGKEVAIAAQRLGVEVIAVDRYENAPAMQVAHRSYCISMQDDVALREIIYREKPNFIVPEIEAIATATLVELEKEGFNVVPSANAVHLTMNREGIRRLAAETLQVRTSAFQFADSLDACIAAVQQIGLPCVMKPIMSSSGKGQSVIRNENEIATAWQIAQSDARSAMRKVIIESFIPFDYEITLLTVRHRDGTAFCAPIGHLQMNGDYRESWQPHPMPTFVLEEAQRMAKLVTDALGGFGVFGVEFFIKDNEVYFSEVSPRPHDTGLVTLISQDLSEFTLHVRAILGLPIPMIKQQGASASYAIVAQGHGSNIQFLNLHRALSQLDTDIRLFGKPQVQGERRVGVLLSLAESIEAARDKNKMAYDQLEVKISA